MSTFFTIVVYGALGVYGFLLLRKVVGAIVHRVKNKKGGK